MVSKFLEIMFIFFKVGLFTIGGGMVAIPLIQQEVVEKGLITAGEFYNMVAVAESTPGPIGINIATYVGYSTYGIFGALAATVSFVVPSFFIVSFLAGLLTKYRTSPVVINCLMYIKAAIVGLIGYSLINVIIHLYEQSNTTTVLYKPLVLLIVLSIAYYFLKQKPWMIIVLGAVCGIIFL